MDGPKRRIRIMRQLEDADDTGDVVAWEIVPAPEWVCERCYTRNDKWRGVCAMCGSARGDGF